VPTDPRNHLNRTRAESFGSVAEAYDRFRPGYPADLIDDLVALAPGRVLDIGSGTGKAARLLADRGLDVVGVEIDPKMAEVAASHGLAVEVGSFETWDDRGRRFDLIISAQAWHWVDPALGAPKAARLLNPGGAMALFWNYEDFADPAVQSVVDSVYAEYAPELSAIVAREASRREDQPHLDDLAATGAFGSLRVRHYRWDAVLSVEEWVGRIGTQSNHIGLEPARRARLEEALRSALTPSGEVRLRGGTYTIWATEPRTGEFEVLTFPAAAEALGVVVTRVHQLVRDGHLVAVRRPDGVRGVPAPFVQGGAVVKHLPAVITQLRDAHYADEEIVDWLFRADDSLPGTPIAALRANRGTEVKRRAQVAGY
jgi:SAM-dependent methyltransferase